MEEGGRQGKLKAVLIIAAACAAAVIVFIAAFWVNRVYVDGNERYTDEEIRNIALKEPIWHNSVIYSLFFKNVDVSSVPFVDSIEVEYVSRNSILLNVEETIMAGYFRVEGYDYYFDSRGRVLLVQEEGEESLDKYVPRISGLNASNIALGLEIRFEDPDIIYTIISLTTMLRKYEIAADLVSFDSDENITLYYGNIKVLLGKDELLEEKMMRMAAILSRLEYTYGTLHLENYSEDTQNIIFDTNG